MTRFRVIPYRNGSRSARALAEGLNGLRLRLNGSRFRPRLNDVVINWGNVDPPLFGQNVLNGRTRDPLRPVTNKRSFFEMMRNAGNEEIIPRFWTTREEIPDDAFPVVCRTVLAGHSGEGIVIANDEDELVNAPLYTEYTKKQHEYRIHVGISQTHGGYSVIDQQQKRRRIDVPDDEVNWQVRNHHNGFIYAREDCNPPAAVATAAIDALECSGFDFGAVDVIWNNHHQRAYVLEINTAPGLEGTTLENYVNYFRSYERN